MEKWEIYSDESQSANRRFCSLAAVSGRQKELYELRTLLRDVLKRYSLSEVKFEKVRSHKPLVDGAKEFLKIAS